jgi:hypothetical protein
MSPSINHVAESITSTPITQPTNAFVPISRYPLAHEPISALGKHKRLALRPAACQQN